MDEHKGARLRLASDLKSSTILSIQVGTPKTYQHDGATNDEDRHWTSAIFKTTAIGPVELGYENLAGDAQADLRVHGGRDRAVLIYSSIHYPIWEQELGRHLPPGAFGENLLVDTVTEDEVCLGDVWATSGVTMEISQPRLPCFKLARRLDTPGLNVTVMNRMLGGWYCRVLRPGPVSAGETMLLQVRPFPQWPVRRAFREYIFEKNNRDALEELMALPCLSQLWKDNLAKSLKRKR